jgi:hypothetical protein
MLVTGEFVSGALVSGMPALGVGSLSPKPGKEHAKVIMKIETKMENIRFRFVMVGCSSGERQ